MIEEKIAYKVKDIQELLGVGYGTACKIIRQVKSVSDILGVKGLILKQDFDAYISMKNSKSIK